MKKMVILAITFLFVFTIAGMSFASEKNAGKQETVKVTKMKHIVGQVKAIDVNGKTITLTKNNKDTVIALDDETKILLGMEKKAISDLAIGKKVGINYTEIGNKKVAKMVSISFKKHAKLEKDAQ